jgi:hypothetical protein
VILKNILHSIESNDGQAMNQHKSLTMKHWQEAKDWSNTVKVLAMYKQKYQVM